MRFIPNSSLLSVVLAAILLSVTGGGLGCRGLLNDSHAQQKGPIIQLDKSGDLQAAINRAKPGDTIILQAGAIYTGPFTLPVKSGSEYITIQSSRVNELPEGARVSPSQSELFAKLQSAEKSAAVVKTQPGAHHYKFVGIEFSTADENVAVHDLVRSGEANTQTTIDAA